MHKTSFFCSGRCSLCQMASEILKGLCGWFTSSPGLFICLAALQQWMDSIKYLDCVDGKAVCMYEDACLCDTTVLNSVIHNCQMTANSGLINFIILSQCAGACHALFLCHIYTHAHLLDTDRFFPTKGVLSDGR